jgi:hypothetical protein
LQLHELRLAEGSPVGGSEEKEDGAFCSLERLVAEFMAELIMQSKCRHSVADLEADGWSYGVICGRVILTACKDRQSDQEKNANGNFHLYSRFTSLRSQG